MTYIAGKGWPPFMDDKTRLFFGFDFGMISRKRFQLVLVPDFFYFLFEIEAFRIYFLEKQVSYCNLSFFKPYLFTCPAWLAHGNETQIIIWSNMQNQNKAF